MTAYYMHTINGRPGFFDGNQICYMGRYGKPNRLATSLKQIRDELRATEAYRLKQRFTIVNQYSYYRVTAP